MSSVIQRSFAGGEIAPALYSRVDTSKYTTGLRTLRNMFVMRHGGAASRAGTTFIGETKDSSKTSRLIPFVFSDAQTYVLEFGDLYMRVYRNGVQLTLTAQNISAITNANPGVLTYVGSDTYANGDHVQVSGIVGAIGTYMNGRTFMVGSVNAGSNTFNLLNLDGTNFNTTSLGSYTSGGTIAEVYTLTTVYTEAEVATLKFVQSADTVTILCPSHSPRDLTRSGHTSWAFTTLVFGPSILGPSSFGDTSAGSGADKAITFSFTSIDDETGEESLATGYDTTLKTVLTYVFVSFTPASGCSLCNVYMGYTGDDSVGWVGVGGSGVSFYAALPTPDYTLSPPIARDPFAAAENPSCLTYYQQRMIFGNTPSSPEGVWGSQTGRRLNFCKRNSLRDDDAVTFSMNGRQVNEVRHLLDLGKLIIFTATGEFAAEGNDAGILTPTGVNIKQQSYNGSSDLPPLVVDGMALYVQARGSIVRDLGFQIEADGYRGTDLTIFSAHLVDGYEIVDWAYQKTPHSVVWAVRDDGVLLSLTYVREQQIFAWARHDTDGTVENVVCVPEGDEDAVYLIIKRTVNGSTKRFVERLNQRRVEDIVDYVGMDAALTYDGRYTGAITMTLSGGTDWTYDETLTLTASHPWSLVGNANAISAITKANPAVVTTTASHGFGTGDMVYITGVVGMTQVNGNYYKVTVASATTFSLQTLAGVNVDSSAYGAWSSGGTAQRITAFSAADVGNAIFLTGADDELIRFTITGFTSVLVVTGTAHHTVPASLRSTATASWSKAVDSLSGLWHLEGQDVSVFADGFVVSNPNNASYDVITVTHGQITLPRPYAVIQVGLPFISDLETLNIATVQSVAENKKKLVQSVTAQVDDSRGIWVGAAPPTDDDADPLEGLYEMKLRRNETQDEPVSLVSGDISIQIKSEWNSNGRVFIRQVDPVPMTILSVVPSGLFTVGGQ